MTGTSFSPEALNLVYNLLPGVNGMRARMANGNGAAVFIGNGRSLPDFFNISSSLVLLSRKNIVAPCRYAHACRQFIAQRFGIGIAVYKKTAPGV